MAPALALALALALACAQMRAFLSRCVIARAMRGPEKRDQSGSLRGPRRLRAAASRYRTHSSRGFILCSFYVALRSHTRELENSRVYVASTLSRMLRSSARPSKPCSYSFLTQGKIACENILTARICTAVRTGAKRGTHFVSILCT